MAEKKAMKDYHDLRKYMTSVGIPSPALGAVAHHIEIERLAEHWVVGAQAEITLTDIERVSKHYGFNRDFANRCFNQLKKGHRKLGANEIYSTLTSVKCKQQIVSIIHNTNLFHLGFNHFGRGCYSVHIRTALISAFIQTPFG